ncbi:MAG: hypothetical protein WC827_03665 [Candidatus Paceibacterota bacterium]
MATDKALKKAAIELNDLMGLTPEINVKGDTETLTKGIKAAMKHVTPEDEFSDETQAVLDEFSTPAKKVAPALAVKKKAAPVVVEEEEDEDEEEEEVIAPPKKGKKAPVVVEEDDEEDDEEEEIPAPKAKKKVAPAPEPPKKKKVVVVEEDDEEDDEDNEPVAPVKKGKQAVPVEKKVVKKAFPGKTAISPSRLVCIAQAILAITKPVSIEKICTAADANFVKVGGKTNVKQTIHILKYILPAASEWGIVSEKDGIVTLK